MWDFYQDDVNAVSYTMRGPQVILSVETIHFISYSGSLREIFSLLTFPLQIGFFTREFDTILAHLSVVLTIIVWYFSAGTCERIFQYDVAYIGTPSGTSTTAGRLPDHVYEDNNVKIGVNGDSRSTDMLKIGQHTVFDLPSISRRNTYKCKVLERLPSENYFSIENIISEDGTIRRYDWRQGGAPPSNQDIIQTGKEVTDVKTHPTMEHIFADCDVAGRVSLRDARMAFGSLPKRSNEGIIQRVCALVGLPNFGFDPPFFI